MNLNLSKNVILITEDCQGICQQIFNVLMHEGAHPIIIKKQELRNIEQNKIDAFINIIDINDQNYLSTINSLNHFSHGLEEDFSVINIKTSMVLSLKLDTNELLHLNIPVLTLKKIFQLKTNTIVFENYDNNILLNDIKNQIANTAAFLLSKRSNHINNQTFFVGNVINASSNNTIIESINTA